LWPRRRALGALQRFARRPTHDLARDLGSSPRAIEHVQRMLLEHLKSERSVEEALLRTRMVLEHLQQDRSDMAQVLLAARSEVRRHEPIGFDHDLMAWLE